MKLSVEVRLNMVNDEADPRHGTLNGYTNYRCHCARCRNAKRAYDIEHGKVIKLDRSTMFIDYRSFVDSRPRGEPSGMPFERRPFDVQRARDRASEQLYMGMKEDEL